MNSLSCANEFIFSKINFFSITILSFKNKISSKSLGYGVRNAVIDVESELHVHKVWVYNPDNVAVQFSRDSKAKS